MNNDILDTFFVHYKINFDSDMFRLLVPAPTDFVGVDDLGTGMPQGLVVEATVIRVFPNLSASHSIPINTCPEKETIRIF